MFRILSCSPVLALLAGGLAVGCHQSNQIDITLEGERPILTLRAARWDADFQPTLVSGLAIATEGEAIWEIETSDPTGVPAADLVIPYGELPRGFVQITPPDRGPRPLRRGETYYIGATGPDDAVWRAVFALPVSRYGIDRKPDWFEEEEPPKADLSGDD